MKPKKSKVVPLDIERLAKLARDASEMLPVSIDHEGREQTLRDANGMTMAGLLAEGGDVVTPFDAYLVAAVNSVPHLVAEIRRYRALARRARSVGP